jgi:hypothetical protein
MVFSSRFMPCEECGASVDRRAETEHTCDAERLLDYRMFGLREEIASLESGLVQFLESPDGRFQRWLAARDVRRSGPT